MKFKISVPHDEAIGLIEITKKARQKHCRTDSGGAFATEIKFQKLLHFL